MTILIAHFQMDIVAWTIWLLTITMTVQFSLVIVKDNLYASIKRQHA